MKSVITWLVEKSRIESVRQVKRFIVAVVGMTVLIVGVAMLILPGPAVVVIPLGLAILGTEFVWARRLLQKAKGLFQKQTRRAPEAREVEIKPRERETTRV